MKAFAALFARLDETNKTTQKVEALANYFLAVPPADAAWGVYFLTGRKPRQIVPTRKLCQWAMERAGTPDWMFRECYDAVGDLAETVALLLPAPTSASEISLSRWMEERLLPLQRADEAMQRRAVLGYWDEMDERERLVFNKLITGGFRVGVSAGLVIRALEQVSGLDGPTLSHRMMGEWRPTEEFYRSLIGTGRNEGEVSRPYPFFLAHPLDARPESLGEPSSWQVEWKWDGIRAQLLRRAGQTFLWSRGEDLITERFPEISAVGERLAEETVIDGEVMPWRGDEALPFAQLQRRIGRKNLSKKILSEVPVVLVAYDLLEHEGQDIRALPLSDRRLRLESVIASMGFQQGLVLSPLVAGESWAELAERRAESRGRRVEGLMLKRKDSPYRVGRQRGDWWKWKIDPFSIDAVLIHAQPGNGKRASLFTDYTFGVWDQGKLVPFAKAYSGLTDAEIRDVDAFVRKNTLDKFGPVRTVKPELVFELGFEAIAPSARHKSGVAVRFPRMLRWRKDKPASDADTLHALKSLLPNGTRTPESEDDGLPLLKEQP